MSLVSKSSLDEIEEVDLKEMFESQAKVKQSFDNLATKIIKKKNPTTAYKISGKKNVDFYNANSKTDANKKFLIYNIDVRNSKNKEKFQNQLVAMELIKSDYQV